MPKMNIDYSKCVMYRIVCKDLNIQECYIGHTTNLTKRKYQHKFKCNTPNSKGYNLKIYQFIRENGGYDNWELIKIEDYPCENIYEACKRERYWKEYYNANLNLQIPSRTKEEWINDNPDKNKIYYQSNKEIFLEKQKIYNQQNKEHIKIYQKQYYEENANKIKQYKSEKIKCECGCEITKCSLTRHKKTQKHQELMNSLKPD